MPPLAHMLLGLLLGAAQSAPSEPTTRLELRVFEADCKPARVDANLMWDWGASERVLYCARCPKGETPNPWRQTPEGVRSTSPGGGDSVFFVEPGARYVYGYVGKDIQPIEGEVTIGMNAPLTVRELHIDPVVRIQSLEIHLLRPDWRPIDHDVQVSLDSLVTGLTLLRSEMTPYDFQYKQLLPVGRYRLRIETEEPLVGWCAAGWAPKPAPFGAWVETVDLCSGDPLQIEAFFWRGGKLRLALELPLGVETRKQWLDRYPTRSEPLEGGWLALSTKGPGARVTLRADPSAPVTSRERGAPEIATTPVRFFCMPMLYANYKYDVILPGDEQTSADWIPPGAYIARIEARDFEPVEAKVRIQVDETTELRVKLTPR